MDLFVPPPLPSALSSEGPSGGSGIEIRGDRLLPQAQPREDVRRHMVRVSRRRGDLGIAPRGAQSPLGELRIVVAVNDVVGGARMIGLGIEHRFEQHSRLELVLEGLVRGERRCQKRECVEDCGFSILRMAGVQLRHGPFVGQRALAVRTLLEIPIERRDRPNVPLLAFGTRTERLRALHELRASLQVCPLRRHPQRMEQAHRHPPVRHGAGHVALRSLAERDLGPLVLEGVQPGDGHVEGRMRLRVAGDRELDPTQLALIGCARALSACGQREQEPRRQRLPNYEASAVHGLPIVAPPGPSRQDSPMPVAHAPLCEARREFPEGARSRW